MIADGRRHRPAVLPRAARGGAPPPGALSRPPGRAPARAPHGAGRLGLHLAGDRGVRGHPVRDVARACPRGGDLLHHVFPEAEGAARGGGLPQPHLPPHGRQGHRRAHEGAPRGGAGRDHRGRADHLPHRRVPLRLRAGADAAGRRSLRGAPHAGEGGPHPPGAGLMAELILSRNFSVPDAHTLRVYREGGGYKGWDKAKGMEPAAITEEVKKSNLRGLGGAGFPTGVKWGFIPKGSTAPKYLVVNADEGEPGTFKDRYILERDPHALIEGMMIAARAIDSRLGYVYIRGEYVQPWRIFSAALKEAYDAGLLGAGVPGGGFDIVVHRGAGAYICGEETGLISSLEGKKGWPKVKPPFPAVKGAFGHPTIVNNVETLACLPHILTRGAEWFAGLGTKTQGGTRLYSVSGHVVRPGVVEAPVSVTLHQLIYEQCGGMRDGRKLKAVVPGGSSAAILTPDEIDIAMDVDGPKSKGSMIGSAGIVVMDDTVSIPDALMVVARFYAHESCGQCTPCRESTGWIYKMTHRIVEGKGRKEDLDTILDVAKRGAGTTICAFYDGAVGPYISYIEKFREEFEALIRSGAHAHA